MTGTKPAKPWTRRRKLASLAAIAAYAGAIAVLFSGAGMLTRGATLVTWEVVLLLALFVAGAIALSVAHVSRPPLPPRPDYALIASMECEVFGETYHHDGAPVIDAFAEACAVPDTFARDTQVVCPDCGEKSPYLPSVGHMQQWIEAHVENCREIPDFGDGRDAADA